MPVKIPLRCPHPKRNKRLLGYVYIHTKFGEPNIDPKDAEFVFWCNRCKDQHRLSMETLKQK